MLDPIMAQLQHQLYNSVLKDLESILKNGLGLFSKQGSSLKARSSEFDQLLTDAAQRYDLDPALLRAVAQTESNFSATAVSHAGAKGIMQLMDATARQLGVTNIRWRSLDFDIVIKIHTPKNNSRINSSRPERDVYLLSRVQADTGRTNDIFERSLSDHLVIF